MSGSKAPDFDTYELLRATHYHNSTQYSHIVELSSHFYALMSTMRILKSRGALCLSEDIS